MFNGLEEITVVKLIPRACTNTVRILLIVTVLLQGCGLLLSTFASASQYEGKFIKGAGGDSITILIEDTQFRVRLAEIDAPERGQPFWRKSRDALADYVAGKVVTIFKINIDRYERIVG